MSENIKTQLVHMGKAIPMQENLGLVGYFSHLVFPESLTFGKTRVFVLNTRAPQAALRLIVHKKFRVSQRQSALPALHTARSSRLVL